MHDWRAYVRRHLPPLKVSPEREGEIVAELALQIEQAYTEELAGGAEEPEAFRRALLPFRDWQALAREIELAERQPAPPLEPEPRGSWWTGTAHDIRYALRFLRRSPGFAAIAVCTLAFGIGGNTAIFTMVDAVALRKLPYPDPGRILSIETRKVNQPEVEPWASAADFFDLRERTRAFSSIASISPVWNVVMTGRGEAERLESLYVSAAFFPMLGVKPQLGRVFSTAEDNRAQPSAVVILSHGLWERRFGANPGVLGQAVNLDNGMYTVIGVLPADFRYAGDPLAGREAQIDAWFPMAANQLVNSIRALRYLKVIGRLAPGVSLEQARGELRRIGAALAEQYPESDRGFVIDAQSLRSQVTGPFRVSMLLLLGAVGFVLLMACANVANLLLARASAREREISVRVALGASRMRLLRQLLTEGFVLAAIGGSLGLLLAYFGLRALVAAAPGTLLRAGEVSLDVRALLFTLAAVTSSALLAGLPPAWRMVRADLESALREAGRGLTAGNHRLRSALVVLQMAVALLLLVGSGLLIRSFQRVLGISPGFDARNLVTISTQMPGTARTPAQRAATYRLIHDRLMAVPGVRSAAAVSRLPLMGSTLGSWMFVEGQPLSVQARRDVEYRVATSDYFATMGIPLRAGRLYDQHDDANAGSVLLVNQTAARLFWPGEEAVGKRVKLGANPEQQPWITVIGVVGDLRHEGLDVAPRPEIYRPYPVNPLGAPILVIRTGSDVRPLIPMLTAAIQSVSAEVPAYNIYEMETLVARSTAQRRFVMWLLTGFAVAALLLAGVGIYGMLAQAVVQRTQEIGLRMALGASPAKALALVLGQGIRLMLAGMAAGSLAAIGLTRLMRKLLFEVRPLDPLVFGAAAAVLALIAMLACYLPARRATRVDPMTALRSDG